MPRHKQSVIGALSPPPRMDIATFAAAECQLPMGSAITGRWKSYPYQDYIMRCMTINSGEQVNGQPIDRVSTLKPVQVGFTTMFMNGVAYYIKHRPCPIGIYLPRQQTAKEFASGILNPYIDSQTCLDGLVTAEVTADGKSSERHKKYPGGQLWVLSAERSQDLRSKSIKVIMYDECDVEPDEIGVEGSKIELMKGRQSAQYPSMLIIGSSPVGTKETSTIWREWLKSDQSRLYLPCPKCSHFQYLTWDQFEWPIGKPEEVVCKCVKCGHGIREKHKLDMLDAGKWQATNPHNCEPGHKGFSLSTFYSPMVKASWPMLARKWDDSRYDEQKQITFYNTICGLPSPLAREGRVDPEDLMNKVTAGHFLMQPPDDVLFITAGCDVQGGPGTKDARLEVSFWGHSKECLYFIGHENLPGDPSKDDVWGDLDDATQVHFTRPDGLDLPVKYVAIDTGGLVTQKVYEQIRLRSQRWLAIKGTNISTSKEVANSPIRDRITGRKVREGDLWVLNVAKLKDQLYTRLRDLAGGEDRPGIQFPEDLPVEFADQICSEHRTEKPGGKVEWALIPSKRNEVWDCLVYAYAARLVYVMGREGWIWDKLGREVGKQAREEADQQKQQQQARFRPIPRRISFGD